MMNMLWVSRHVPTIEQKTSLVEIFQEPINLVVYPKSIRDADEIIALMKEHDCKEVVAVLPLNLFADLTEKGVKPIRAMMGRVVKPGGKSDYSHIHFERILDVKVTSETLTAPAREAPGEKRR